MTETNEKTGTAARAGKNILQGFLGVLTRPTEFFRTMPHQGGFPEPLLFLVAAGLASGVIQALLSLVGLGHSSIGMSFAMILLGPVIAAVFGFVVAAILFAIWKIMGSGESFETAYRCMAYGAAIMPFTRFLLLIPYLGLLLALAWQTYLLVVASMEVHKLGRKPAMAVFGIIALIFAATGLSAQYAARSLQHNFARMKQNQNAKDPGQAVQDLGKLMQQFGKNMNKNKTGN